MLKASSLSSGSRPLAIGALNASKWLSDLDARCKEHFSGRACRTTMLDPASALVYSEEFRTFSEARRREAQVKRWSRAKKEALVSGDITMLQALA
ncbi:MAG: GIY-YIG nuclease family protein [Nitrospiraceae bacterium]